MTFEELKNTYRANKNFFSVTKQFGKSISKISVNFAVFFFYVLDLFKLNSVFQYFLNRILREQEFKSSLVGFVLTKNQNHILVKIRELGYQFPVFFFNYNEVTNKLDYYISNRIILLGVLANKGNATLLKQASKDEYLSNDLVRVIRTIGLEKVYNRLLINKHTILSFNDHTLYNILLFDVAKKAEIKTIYIQHAPVSYKFPPLYHDINILFSQDSKNKYRVNNETVQVKIACDLRFLINKENYKLKEGVSKTILVCTNALDNLKIVGDFVNAVSITHKVILRPHPNDLRNWNKLDNCEISKNSILWADLSLCNLVVTNESGVPLEAVFLGKNVYKAAFFSTPLDNYSFLKTGLIKKQYFNLPDLITAIKNNEINIDADKLNYFIGNTHNVKNVLDSVFNLKPA